MKKQFTLRIKPDLLKKIRIMAINESLSVSGMIEKLLLSALGEDKKNLSGTNFKN